MKLKDTIKSRNGGYSVETYVGKKTGKTFCKVYDGENHLFTAQARTWEHYNDERKGNDCFVKYEIFSTKDGKQFIYWGDTEIYADYVTEVVN